ncbi:MAG TPA: tripartite tricarboxylate transporter substrate-binding protein [Burkholderiales bacterium]|nr:tripartite tricarboxylate transporter substrate-binding protein [Burkholderiales bacterium]
MTAPAVAQNYPTKPVRIVTSPAGGGNDFPARLIAAALPKTMGQQFIVDNRPTVLIADLVAKAPPDGHTLLVTGSAHWIGPLVEKVNYDPIRDFAPITLIDRSPSVLVVHPSMPVKSVKQLIAIAKAKPGDLNFSVGGPGTSNFIAAILFNYIAGVNTVRIPYKGTGPALAAVVTGEVHAMFGSAGGAAPHVRSGRLRALAVGSAQPSALAPGVPTLEQAGMPGFISEALHALYAPAGTPPAVVARVNQEVSRYLLSPEARDIFMKAGIEASPGTPEELTAIMRSEIDRVGKAFKAAGVGIR